MKKILIALDYSRNAQQIAETGYALAKAMGAGVLLLHVMAEASYYATYEYSPIMGFNSFMVPDHLPPNTLDEIKKSAAEFLDKSREHLGDTAIITLVKEGEIANTIVQTAAAEKADIIVMGSHSRSGLEKILMGSVAGRVLQHSNIPLFIIPSRHIA